MGTWKHGHTKESRRTSALVLGIALLAGCTFIASQEKERPVNSSIPARASSIPVMNEGDADYKTACRSKGVPIPPDWNMSSSEWESHGNLTTILLTPNTMDMVQPNSTTFASVWSYAPPTGRGACLALGRSDGSFQVICQSAETGHACFWGNDPNLPATRWNPKTMEVNISSLRDPVQGFAPGAVSCTECHRGTNAFLIAPDDPTWAKVLRPGQAQTGVSVKPRHTFTVRVEHSPQQKQSAPNGTPTTRPRFIPIGGKAVALSNPLPTTPGCSGDCHELHVPILGKGHTSEGYVRIPRPMGPNCASNSPPEDPARTCYE
jgi:hypothetical protein